MVFLKCLIVSRGIFAKINLAKKFSVIKFLLNLLRRKTRSLVNMLICLVCSVVCLIFSHKSSSTLFTFSVFVWFCFEIASKFQFKSWIFILWCSPFNDENLSSSFSSISVQAASKFAEFWESSSCNFKDKLTSVLPIFDVICSRSSYIQKILQFLLIRYISNHEFDFASQHRAQLEVRPHKVMTSERIGKKLL